jgi:hypothetical protein
MAEIPELKHIKGLPVSFKLLTATPLGEEKPKNLFFSVKLYQGMAKTEIFYKNYSKAINWKAFSTQ